ncbi:hypothetical protein SAMN05216223_10315 [Actinacidiphila yanglinensis]|uniref:Uncharacterized protein n=1 Tax=Actinacidiphila yanglinensis TaxID=310779 RepID=A0A1H5WXH7_9ACTN|nr:hypothetical protein SAMN05216223_10315 [Actinacidiphila yanglinensis]
MVLALVGGALWWLAVLRLGLPPGASGSPVDGLHAVFVAGGWSLGLIPIHAVPVRRREATRRRVGTAAPVAATPGIGGDQPAAGEDGGPGIGPRWHRGHQ